MITGDAIDVAARYIREGKLVAFPTETVYGLGANALDPLAVARIYELKERPSFDPLIVHIADLSQLDQLVIYPDERVQQLARRFWPGPLTMVLPKSDQVPDIVTSGLDTVGIRMPDNELARELIRRSGCPIAAPSANKFGRVSPTSARHVKKQLPGVDYILEGGPAQVGIESTIISLGEKGFNLLRHGVITREEIEAIVPFQGEPADKKGVLAPGMMKSHYSPAKPLYIAGESLPQDLERTRAGLISFTRQHAPGYHTVIALSEKGDLKECAVHLFSAIHQMEEADVDYIVAEPVPEQGIGIAIMDRLRKAAYQYRKD